MIELTLPKTAPAAALDELRMVIKKHATGGDGGEQIALTVGDRRLELPDTYRVEPSEECLTALFRAIDASL